MSDKFTEYDGEVSSPMEDMSRTGYGRGYQQGRQDAIEELIDSVKSTEWFDRWEMESIIYLAGQIKEQTNEKGEE